MPLSQLRDTPVSGDITGNNQSVGPLVLEAGETASVSVLGTFVSTVRLQRQLPGQATWQDVPDDAGNHIVDSPGAEKSYVADERQSIQLATGAADYTSGTATCRLGKR